MSVIWQVYKYIRSYVFDTYISWMSYFKNFFTPSDYKISKICVISTIDYKNQTTKLPVLWEDMLELDEKPEEDYNAWFVLPQSRYNELENIVKNKPSFVNKLYIQTSFWYRGEKKKYLNVTPEKSIFWPPHECTNKSPSFTLPIKTAQLITLDETEDVTSRIKKFSGPFGDFYGKDIIPHQFFLLWDTRDIQHFDCLEITDILGFKKEYTID